MNICRITLAGEALCPLPSGALWWPGRRVLVAGDLHLGKAERMARQGRGLLPPYETADTINRLDEAVGAYGPETIILLGDSFDDMGAGAALDDALTEQLRRMAAGRQWIWIAGNHDPGPLDLPGQHRAEVTVGPLSFRHIARQGAAPGEISAHYHPKARLRVRGQSIRRPCFLADGARLILPAFGTYTGGLDIADPVFDRLFAPDAQALLTGRAVVAMRRAVALARG